jgi:hypothetical protein
MVDGKVRQAIGSRSGVYFVSHVFYSPDIRVVVEKPWRRASSVLALLGRFTTRHDTAGGNERGASIK